MNMITTPAALTAGSTALREYGQKDGSGAGDGPTLETLQKQLATVLGTVKEAAEDFKAKAASGEQISQGAKDKADEALTKLTELRSEMTELSQKLAASRRDGENGSQAKSLGQMVGERPEIKDFVSNGCAGSISMSIKTAVTSAAGSAGSLIANDRVAGILGLPTRQLRIRDLLTPGRTESNSVDYARQVSRTNNAAMVAETTQKPESAYVWELANAPVRTLAHWVPASRQAMDDIPQLESLIDGELRFGLDDVEDQQLLLGDGTGQNLSGLYTAATPYAAPIVIDGATRIDQLRLAFLQVELADFAPDAGVIHPSAWAGIELTKDANGGYIFANPQGLAGPVLWGRPIVPTKAIGAANFLVGGFKVAGQIFDRMETEVRISDQDRDNFIKNMLTIRAEKRLALAIRRAAALVKGALL